MVIQFGIFMLFAAALICELLQSWRSLLGKDDTQQSCFYLMLVANWYKINGRQITVPFHSDQWKAAESERAKDIFRNAN